MHQIDGNKIIAKFMGMEITNVDVFDDTLWVRTDLHNGRFEETNACFHFSWDWLIPVVEKIENTSMADFAGDCIKRFSFESTGKYCLIQGHTDVRQPYCIYQTPYVFNPETKIEAVWLAVVEFIKWHNEQNNNKGKESLQMPS